MSESDWLSVQAYAKKYGIATKTVRRRVKCPEKWGLEVKRIKSERGSNKIVLKTANDINSLTKLDMLKNEDMSEKVNR